MIFIYKVKYFFFTWAIYIYIIKTKPKKMYRYLIIDIETSGQYVSRNEIMAIGACIGNSKTGVIENEFQIFLKPRDGLEFVWEQQCLDEFWDRADMKKTKDYILKQVESNGFAANIAMNSLFGWIRSLDEETKKTLIIMTDTAGYDIGFLNYYLSNAGLPSMFYIIDDQYRPIRDSSSFHMGVGLQLPEAGLWGAEEAAMKQIGDSDAIKEMKNNPYSMSHLPMDDAKYIFWQIFCIAKMIRKKQEIK